mgnify:CR=1 FL=1
MAQLTRWITDFFQELFKDVSPIVIATRVRATYDLLKSSVQLGLADVAAQTLVILTNSQPFLFNWRLAGRTVAVAALPMLIAILRESPQQVAVRQYIAPRDLPDDAEDILLGRKKGPKVE